MDVNAIIHYPRFIPFESFSQQFAKQKSCCQDIKDGKRKMGSCYSTEQAYRSKDSNLFAEPDGTEFERTHNKFSLTDEYAFDELLGKVLKVGTDCVVHQASGAVCGRIFSTLETRSDFGFKILLISISSIRSNGNVFFKSQQSVSVLEYTGKKQLSQLEIRPILLGEKEKLCERGRKFMKLALGAHYMMYSDKMFIEGRRGIVQFSAEGRVMVDSASFLHFNPSYGPMEHARQYGHSKNHVQQSTEWSRTIPESSLQLCSPTLCGFSLATKKWGEIAVDNLSEIQFGEDAFDMLVLEQGPKDLVRGLVQNINKDHQFTDIIQGKGGGCSFLLQGPPGIGKTLTAECVSECLRRPLYCIDVGELGITPKSLENRLKDILEVAERWNAVVLIDECDIFLASRNKNDVLRNAMVGIFLRLIEYYNGILFLTSNRADDMDKAFQSRISVTLEYKALDSRARKQVWSNLLSAAGADESVLDVNKLAEYVLNGRQIKTAIRLATSLAGTVKEPLGQKHLVKAIQYSNAGLSEKGDN